MTEREKEIVNLIKSNPLITQEELAAELNCARTSIAVHISNLMKKGVIIGKKYIINEEPYILTIGGTNIDIQGTSYNKLIRQDSNPGSINISYGGVGKNIAENIRKLGLSSTFITAFGDDIYGKDIQSYLKKISIDINDSLVIPDTKSAMYISILDENNEMDLAVSSMDICKHITPDYLNSIRKKLTAAELLVVDTNLETETLEFITHLRKKPKIILDTVSTKKALKVKNFIGRFDIIKPNLIEAETLSGITINNDDDLKKVGSYFINKGVEKVYISLGARGVFYMNEEKNGIIAPPKINVVSTNGAGDAFVAGIAYGEFNKFDIEKSTRYGVAASALTALDINTITDKVNLKNIESIMEEME